MSLRTILSNYGFVFQRELFPALEEELGPLGARYELHAQYQDRTAACTCGLIERLAIDPSLRRLCGWSRAGEVPGEATFSRAFSS